MSETGNFTPFMPKTMARVPSISECYEIQRLIDTALDNWRSLNFVTITDILDVLLDIRSLVVEISDVPNL